MTELLVIVGFIVVIYYLRKDDKRKTSTGDTRPSGPFKEPYMGTKPDDRER